MALNSIIPINTKIQEVEQCEPVSSPSSTSLEEHKSVPDLSSHFNKIQFLFNNHYNNKKSKSMSPKIKYKNILFKNNNRNNDSFYNNLNIEQERKILEKYTNKKKYTNKTEPSSSNYFSLKKNNKKINDIDENLAEKNEILKGNLYNIYSNNAKNKKINKQINDSSFEDINKIENRIISINPEENEKSLMKRKIPKMELKLKNIEKNENSKNLYNNTYNSSFRYSNPNSAKIGIYHRKKILDGKSYGKISKYEGNITTESSIKRDSIKSDYCFDKKNNNININSINKVNEDNKNKKRPLTLNVNIGKKNVEKIKISQIQRIMKDDGFFYVLRFLSYKDIISLFKARNKQLCILINTALINAYYYCVKESLIKYNNIFEILKCTLVLSKIKEALKIDFVINFRFINEKNDFHKHKIKLGPNNNFKEPVYCQICYIYSYYQKMKNKKELITKEEYEKQIKRAKLYDYYTFDLYPEKYKNNIYSKNNPIFISKELSLFEKDGNNNIVNIQPILPFTLNDKGIINLELYTINNGFVDPISIKILVKIFDLKNYLATLSQKNINNPRVAESEEICAHWKNINLYQQHKSLIFRLSKLFEPFFEIKKIYFCNTGVNIFKVELLAVKSGVINDKNKIEIKIRIKDKEDYVENEIRKNNLLFERRDIFEIRVGESLLYYFSMK